MIKPLNPAVLARAPLFNATNSLPSTYHPGTFGGYGPGAIGVCPLMTQKLMSPTAKFISGLLNPNSHNVKGTGRFSDLGFFIPKSTSPSPAHLALTAMQNSNDVFTSREIPPELVASGKKRTVHVPAKTEASGGSKTDLVRRIFPEVIETRMPAVRSVALAKKGSPIPVRKGALSFFKAFADLQGNPEYLDNSNQIEITIDPGETLEKTFLNFDLSFDHISILNLAKAGNALKKLSDVLNILGPIATERTTKVRFGLVEHEISLTAGSYIDNGQHGIEFEFHPDRPWEALLRLMRFEPNTSEKQIGASRQHCPENFDVWASEYVNKISGLLQKQPYGVVVGSVPKRPSNHPAMKQFIFLWAQNPDDKIPVVQKFIQTQDYEVYLNLRGLLFNSGTIGIGNVDAVNGFYVFDLD